MTSPVRIEGQAAALRLENLDTDQIMPKQFLRGIDKSGLAAGLLYDLRFDPTGRPRPDFVLNRLMDDADQLDASTVAIDLTDQTLHSRSVQARFDLLPRHRRMFLEGLDSIGLTLRHADQIQVFADAHWQRQPWLRDVAAGARRRVSQPGTTAIGA